jgi:hypothetical protein
MIPPIRFFASRTSVLSRFMSSSKSLMNSGLNLGGPLSPPSKVESPDPDVVSIMTGFAAPALAAIEPARRGTYCDLASCPVQVPNHASLAQGQFRTLFSNQRRDKLSSATAQFALSTHQLAKQSRAPEIDNRVRIREIRIFEMQSHSHFGQTFLASEMSIIKPDRVRVNTGW